LLIVDDNEVNRSRVLSDQVARWGMQPTLVEHGRAAIDAMRPVNVQEWRAFDLVLLDANMPGMDGFAVAEAIAGNHTARRRERVMTAGPRLASTAHQSR